MTVNLTASALAGISVMAAVGAPLQEEAVSGVSVLNSDLARIATPSLEVGPDYSGVKLLDENREAIRARHGLLQLARARIDLQTYIFDTDPSSRELVDDPARAAERGVRVRILIDDYGSPEFRRKYRNPLAHPNIEVRVFNAPFSRILRPLAYVVRFPALHRRMHNKALMVDGLAAIVGGRNVGDAYFSDNGQTFGDLDVLAVGPVVREVEGAFASYWAAPQSKVVWATSSADLNPSKPLQAGELTRKLSGS